MATTIPTLSVVQPPSNGTLDSFEGAGPSGLGDFTYTPDAGFIGKDTFVYEISDELSATDQATVTITVQDAGPSVVDGQSFEADYRPLLPAPDGM